LKGSAALTTYLNYYSQAELLHCCWMLAKPYWFQWTSAHSYNQEIELEVKLEKSLIPRRPLFGSKMTKQ